MDALLRPTCVAINPFQELQVRLQLWRCDPCVRVQPVQLLLGAAALQALWRHGEQVAQLLLREVPARKLGARTHARVSSYAPRSPKRSLCLRGLNGRATKKQKLLNACAQYQSNGNV